MAELIFDVGMHNGNDTAYYLASGYDVVAVEANPELCKAAEERFPAEIAAGRLIVHNVGIAEQDGQLEFWVSDWSEWSSFHKEQATKGGISASPVAVPTMHFADLLNKYPAALFTKIDIERNDTLCIHELERCSSLPTYVYFELSFEGTEAVADIQFLTKLGYHEFKCIRQNELREITLDNMRWQMAGPHAEGNGASGQSSGTAHRAGVVVADGVATASLPAAQDEWLAVRGRQLRAACARIPWTMDELRRNASSPGEPARPRPGTQRPRYRWRVVRRPRCSALKEDYTKLARNRSVCRMGNIPSNR